MLSLKEVKRILAICHVLLLLTSNVGLTFATHYCGGKAVKTDVSFIGQSDIGCGMEGKDNSCDNPEMPSIKSNCCQNKFVEVSVEDDFSSPKIVKSSVDYKFVAAFAISYINLYSLDASAEVEYLNYLPPLLDLDIPVLIQSFLL